MRQLYLVALALVLSACDLARPAVTVQSYLPSPLSGRATQALDARMGRFDVAPAFEGKPLVWRLSETRYESDFYNEFLSTPRALLRDRTIAWFGFKDAADPKRTTLPNYLLEGYVKEIYGDARSSSAHAVVSVRFTLSDAQGRALLDRDYAARIPMKDKSPATLALGVGQAFDENLRQLERDAAALPRTAVK